MPPEYYLDLFQWDVYGFLIRYVEVPLNQHHFNVNIHWPLWPLFWEGDAMKSYLGWLIVLLTLACVIVFVTCGCSQTRTRAKPVIYNWKR